MMPLKSIHLHPTDKPWMTLNIKVKIKLRQQAFTCGNMSQYNLLCAQVEDMIRKKPNQITIKIELKHSAHLTLQNGTNHD